MSTGEFALMEPEAPWSDEEWEKASRYAFTLWWSEEDQLHLARCVEIPEAISHGDTPEEAINNAIDSVAVYFSSFEDPVERIESWGGGLADILYTSDQVAEILGVNKQRVHALAKSRSTGTKRGRDVLFTAQDIIAMQNRSRGRPKKPVRTDVMLST